MTFLLTILIAYFLGSIPWGYLVAKIQGVDIRKKGSKSTGATNIYRTMGISSAIIVALLDVLKGSAATLIAIFSLNNHFEVAVVILAVIVGHIFSIFLGGKGGKGIATTSGVLFVLIGWPYMFFVAVAWISILALTRLMSLTNLILIFFFPLFFLIIRPDLAYFILGIAVTLLIYWVHKDNIERLKDGKELSLDVKVGFKKKKNNKNTTLKFSSTG